MAFDNSIGHSVYAKILISTDTSGITEYNSDTDDIDFRKHFGLDANVIELRNIRDMPSFGTPANIVKIPSYGRAITQSLGVQADAPDLEFTLNLQPDEWSDTGSGIGSIVNDGVSRLICVNGLASQSNEGTLRNPISAISNWQLYFVGRVESRLINPMRDDASQVTLAFSVQSDFFGLKTIDALATVTSSFYYAHTSYDTGPTSPTGQYAAPTAAGDLPAGASGTRPYVWVATDADGAGQTFFGIG